MATVLAIPKPTGLLLSSCALAALAAALLSGVAWGVNVGLWTSVAVLTTALLTRSVNVPRAAKALAATILAFSFLFTLRDSDSLRIANGFAIVLCLGTMLLPVAGHRLQDTSLGRLLCAPFIGTASIATGALGLVERARAERQSSPTTEHRSKAVLRGLLFATPLLILFGALFASADAVFRSGLDNLGRLNIDVQAFSDRVLTFVVTLILVGGLLDRLSLAGGPRSAPARSGSPTKSVGMIEGGIVLGSLGTLFGSFLLVQFRYLFGARDVVRATHGLSYAEYARSGFFELLFVAALALVVLAGADALLRRERPLDEALFRWLGRILGGMVFLIIASALIRMRLYTDAFGLTELRIYSTVFMLWLALAFVWLFATTLCGHPQRFAFGILVAGLGILFTTNLANPDRLIVLTNLSKPKADFAYLETLGDDAVLALRERIAEVPAAHRAECERLIRRREIKAAKGDWRESDLAVWTLAR